MNTTPNLGLKKPLQTEFYNVDDFNYNSDIIDQAIHDLSENKQNKLSTSQMNALNSGMTTAKREKLDALPTASELNTTFNGKQNTLTTAQLNAVNSSITSAKVAKLDALPTSIQLDGSLSGKANKSDITNISITGTTNNTGRNISEGTLFYLNGTLCKTLVDVTNGATFTDGTNYVTTTITNSLPKVIEENKNIQASTTLSKVCTFNYPRGWKIITIQAIFANSEPQEMFLTQAGSNLPTLGNTQKLSTFTQGALAVTVVTHEANIDVWAKYSSDGQNLIASNCVMLV